MLLRAMLQQTDVCYRNCLLAQSLGCWLCFGVWLCWCILVFSVLLQCGGFSGSVPVCVCLSSTPHIYVDFMLTRLAELEMYYFIEPHLELQVQRADACVGLAASTTNAALTRLQIIDLAETFTVPTFTATAQNWMPFV